LPEIRHRDGQLVLHARRDDFEIQIQRQGSGYIVYAFVCREGKHY
jgi:hypothetical protein